MGSRTAQTDVGIWFLVQKQVMSISGHCLIATGSIGQLHLCPTIQDPTGGSM